MTTETKKDEMAKVETTIPDPGETPTAPSEVTAHVGCALCKRRLSYETNGKIYLLPHYSCAAILKERAQRSQELDELAANMKSHYDRELKAAHKAFTDLGKKVEAVEWQVAAMQRSRVAVVVDRLKAAFSALRGAA